MNSDQIISIARSAILSSIPDVLIPCIILKVESNFNASTNISEEYISASINVECIQEQLTEDEIQASKILATDLKFHILNNQKIDVDFYNKIQIDGIIYTIIKSQKYFFGKDIPIITIFIRK